MTKRAKVHYFAEDLEGIYEIKINEEDYRLFGHMNYATDMIEVMDEDQLKKLIRNGDVITECEKDEVKLTLEDLANQIAGTISFTPDFGVAEKEEKTSGFPTMKVPKNYKPELSNTTRTATKLAKMLGIALEKEDKPDCISLLFHGAPGTGKTIAAAYLAKNLGMEMRSYNISELQSKYIGESEKEITKAFKAAEEGGYVLHFDEIDSLAGAREDASRDHEIKFANCLLQNLDTFKGIFVATTNLLDHLDTAILRRFVLKQEFFNVTDEQALQLAKVYFKRKAPKDLPTDVFAPADFDIVKKGLLFEEDSDITRNFIKERLIEEAALRNGEDLTIPKRRIGFA